MPPCAIEFGARFAAEARALSDGRRQELESVLRKLAVSFGQPHLHSGLGIRLSPIGELWTQAQTGPTGGFLFGVNLLDGALQRFQLVHRTAGRFSAPAVPCAG